MRRQLNSRPLVRAACVLAIAGLAIHAAHAFQVKRNAGALLRRADAALAEGDVAQASIHLSHYLAFEPHDTAALAKYGLALDQRVQTTAGRLQTLLIFEDVLRRDPDRADVRFRLVHCLMGLGKHRLPDAIHHLKLLLPRWTDPAEVEHLLGWCYEAMEEYTEAATWFQKAVHADPARIASSVLLAETLRDRLGRHEEGMSVMDGMVEANPRSVRAYLARAQYCKQEGAGAVAEQDIHRASELSPDDEDVLRALGESAWNRGDIKKAEATVQRALSLHPDNAYFYSAAAAIELRAGHRRAAIDYLRRGHDRLPGCVDLLVGLADLLLDDGQKPAAQKLVLRLHRDYPSTPLLEYLHCRLILAEPSPAAAAVNEADRLLAEVADQGVWPRVILLRARLAQLQGKSGRAIEHYLALSALGENEPALVESLTRLLYNSRRYLEADQVLRKTEQQRPLTKEEARLGALAALAVRDVARAVRLADKAVNSQTRDYRDLLWLAYILRVSGENGRAESNLRRAVRIAPHVPDTWVALVRFLTRTNRRAEAESAMVQLQRELPADRRTATLARCQECLGSLDRAGELFTHAVREQSDDIGTLYQAADFYRRTDQDNQAEACLRRLLEPSIAAPGQEVAWSRRALASIVAGRGPACRDEALKLLDDNARDFGAAVADDRTRAFVLAFAAADRRRALGLYESTLALRPLASDEQFLLVKLYELVGEPAKARDWLQDLLTAHADEPQYLAYFIFTILHHGHALEAAAPFRRLEQLEPDSQRTRELKRELQGALAAGRSAFPG